MTKETILEQCFRDLMEVHSADFSQTPEGKLQAQREAHLMEYLETCLNRDGQQVVREVLDEMNSFSAREKNFYMNKESSTVYFY